MALPSLGQFKPANIRRSVDLPELDVPAMAMNSPFSIVKSTPRRAYAAVEPTEDFRLFLLHNAAAGVHHIYAGEQLINRTNDHNAPTGGCVFHSIVQQVAEGFLRPLRVKDGGEHIW